jgi:hypothetical protein
MSETKPTTLLGDLAKLPSALVPLSELAQWCAWRGARGEDGRWRPASFVMAVDPVSPVSADNPATWCGYATAAGAVQRGEADGIAFVLTVSDPFIVMELGNCRHPRTGSIEIWAQNFLNVNHSYVEASPGGDGCVIWGLSAEGTSEVNWGFALSIDGKPVTVELRRRAQMIVAVTGLQLNAVGELAEIDKGVDWALVWRDRREAAAAARKEEEASEEAEGVPLERALADVENVLLEPAPVYRLWTNGKLKITEMSKAVGSLSEMRTSVERLPPVPAVQVPNNFQIVTDESGYFFKNLNETADGSQPVLEHAPEYPALERPAEPEAVQHGDDGNTPLEPEAAPPDFSVAHNELDEPAAPASRDAVMQRARAMGYTPLPPRPPRFG